MSKNAREKAVRLFASVLALVMVFTLILGCII